MQHIQKLFNFYRSRRLSAVKAILIVCLAAVGVLFHSNPSSASHENSYLPLRIGTGWVLSDDVGNFQIVIKEKETIDNVEYYRVDWIDEMLGGAYQSEYWLNKNDGIYVAGKSAFGRVYMYEAPYLLLKHQPVVGDKWKGKISTPVFSDVLDFNVEKKEVVKTGVGNVEAIKVVFTGKALRVIRWYTKGVGLVKEKTFRKENNRFVLLNDKIVSRTLTVADDQSEDGSVLTFTDKDLQNYGESDRRLEGNGRTGSDKSFTTKSNEKKANYESMLAGTWSIKDEDHETRVTLSSNGQFFGTIKEKSKTVWTYSGNWSVSDNKLVWVYKHNTPQLRPSGSKDMDEIIAVDADELVIQEGGDGSVSRYLRIN